jgi:hypothetical protein
MPNWWEILHTGNPTNLAPHADADGDGSDHLGEYAADTNPTNAGSVLSISAIDFSGGNIVVHWHGGIESRQIVEYVGALTPTTVTWTVLLTNHPPTAVSTNLVDTSATNRTRIYRIRAVRP